MAIWWRWSSCRTIRGSWAASSTPSSSRGRGAPIPCSASSSGRRWPTRRGRAGSERGRAEAIWIGIPVVTEVRVGSVWIGGGNPLALIAGPCVIEDESHLLDLGERLLAICGAASVPLILKASFDKANRTSHRSYRGPGLTEGLRVLGRVKAKLGVPILSDVHETAQVEPAAEVLDVLQIPALLCRQTDLLVAAGR